MLHIALRSISRPTFRASFMECTTCHQVLMVVCGMYIEEVVIDEMFVLRIRTFDDVVNRLE
jgi:hypothetical protein